VSRTTGADLNSPNNFAQKPISRCSQPRNFSLFANASIILLLAGALTLSPRWSIDAHTTTIDPLVDITRLRVRSTGIGCLNPGETFQGIQTNQGKEHEVSVTIMVVAVLFPRTLFLSASHVPSTRTVPYESFARKRARHASFHRSMPDTTRLPSSQC
jgi:hypothetical protein